MQQLAEKLKQRSKALGISNAEAAKLCGLDPRRYGHYLSGRSRPNYENLVKISKALNTSPNILLGFSEQDISDDTAQLVELCKTMSVEQVKMLVSVAQNVQVKPQK